MLYLSLVRIEKNIYKYTLMALLIGTSMFIAVALYSTYAYQSAKYQPFRQALSGKGYMVYSGESTMAFNVDEYLEGFKERYPEFKSAEYTLTNSGYAGSKYATVYGYSDAVGRYHSYLSTGVWYSEGKKDGCISAVVTSGIGLPGETVELDLGQGEKVSIYITGVLGAGASYYDPNHGVGEPDIFKMYTLVDYEQAHENIILMSLSDAEKLNNSYVSGTVYIHLNSSITADEYARYADRLMTEDDANIVTSLSDVAGRTERQILLKVGIILPLAAVAIAFIIIAMVCAAVLNSISEVQDDAKLYIVGMTTGREVALSALSTLEISVVGFALSLGIATIIKGRTDLLIYRLGQTQYAICALTALFFIAMVSLIKFWILKKNSAVDILKKE